MWEQNQSNLFTECGMLWTPLNFQISLANAEAAGELRDQGKNRQDQDDTHYTVPGPQLQNCYSCSYSQELTEFLGQASTQGVNEWIKL